MNIDKDIKKEKQKLIKKAKEKGIYENFGQKEVRKLENKYSDDEFENNDVFKKIRSFDDWCSTYCG